MSDQPNPNRAVDSVTFERLLDGFYEAVYDYAVLRERYGLGPHTEKQQKQRMTTRAALLTAYTQALTTVSDCKAENERLVAEVERVRRTWAANWQEQKDRADGLEKQVEELRAAIQQHVEKAKGRLYQVDTEDLKAALAKGEAG